MTETEAILTAAKRYCIDNFNYWSKQYSDKKTGSDYPNSYSDNDYDLFPRYNVSTAILQELQFYTGDDFADIAECRQMIKVLGQESQSLFTKGEKNKIEANAIQEERDKFNKFIDNVDADFLLTVDPMLYRRRLKKNEQSIIDKELKDNWGVDCYWYPLIDLKIDKKAIFINKEHLTTNDYLAISDFINLENSSRIYEISEDQIDYEIEKMELDSDCYETIYCDKNFTWIIYGSHEGTLSFGGKKVLDFVFELLNDRKELIDKR